MTFRALGTSATLVVTEAGTRAPALELLRQEIESIDLACSRFRDDSELSALNRHPTGQPFAASEILIEAMAAAVRAAEITDGRVDPTVGSALEMIGYDQDFAGISADGPALCFALRPVPGWRSIQIDPTKRLLTVARDVKVDLGATAKALCADRAAARIGATLDTGVLVGLGGDIAVAGPAPEGGWPIRVTDDHLAGPEAPGTTIAIFGGGLATSSTTVRAWNRGGKRVHHLIDPATSGPAEEVWRTASVAAGSCLDANIASTAAIVLGDDAQSWLSRSALAARLVDPAGRVCLVGGWPAAPASEAATC